MKPARVTTAAFDSINAWSQESDLFLSDLTDVVGTCCASDPGPDPFYDPDPIPDGPYPAPPEEP